MQEVLVRQADTFVQACPCFPSQGLRLAHVQQLARRAVRSTRVPQDTPFVADDLRHLLRQLFDGQFLARTGVHRFVATVVVHQEHTQVGQVVYVQELPQRTAVAPARHLLQSLHLRFVEAPYQGRQHVAMFRVIVVVRSIQVCRHHADVVRPVLPVQELTVLQPADFRQRIRLVRLLQFRRQQAALLHRLRSHARIDARRSQELQLPAAVLPCRVYHVHFQYHVLVHEVRQRLLVGHDASHFRCGQEHIFRPFLCEELLHLVLSCQVQFLVRTCHDVRISLPLQFPYDGRSHHSPVSGHIYFRCLFHYFTIPFSRYSARFVRITLATCSAATFCMSCATMMRTSSSNEVVCGFHPSFSFAFVGSPHRFTTSVGR